MLCFCYIGFHLHLVLSRDTPLTLGTSYLFEVASHDNNYSAIVQYVWLNFNLPACLEFAPNNWENTLGYLSRDIKKKKKA